MTSQEVRTPPLWRRILARLQDLNIRLKIITPYLILTSIVAIIGLYVITSLVFESLDERLNNYTIEAGRVASDFLVRQEISHQDVARAIAFTDGVAAALQQQDADRIDALVRPIAVNDDIEFLLVVSAEGNIMLHLAQKEGELQAITESIDLSYMSSIQNLLQSGDPEAQPQRALGLYSISQRYYYFTTIPVEADNTLVGVVTIGTAVDTLLPQLKTASLADITIYLNRGEAVASTLTRLVSPAEGEPFLKALSITPALYEERLRTPEFTQLDTVEIGERSYRLAIGPLRIGNESLGLFSVALPTDFVFTAGEASRNSYLIIFGFATIAVISMGYVISLLIIRPLHQLARTSRAVAEGDLDRRTGIDSQDEIGLLARTFDHMTASLAERNAELKELLRAQQETNSRMRAILSSIGDGVLLEDTQGVITPANTAAEVMLEEMATSFELGPLRELTESQNWSEGEPYNPWLLESRRFQVANKVFSAHSATVETDDSEKLGTVVVLRDITAEVEAEQLKDAFVEHVSHELRTPLTAIKGYSALLLTTAGENLNVQQRIFIETIINQTESLTTMVNALLDFSEMQASGRLGVRPQPTALPPVVDDLVEEWQPKLEDKGIELEVDVDRDVPLVNGDARRLRWALMNLIRNAYQYTPEGGKVAVRLGSQNDRIYLEVSDTGIGISSEDQRRIFSRFYRVMNVKDDEVRGLGLGLYVTKAIMDAHQGQISVNSELGVGSTFKINMPVMPDKETRTG